MNKFKLNTLVAVLFPVVLALLIIWAIPSASTLRADDSGSSSVNEDSNAEVIVVPTTVTDKSLQELTNKEYTPKDSLNKPVYFSEATSEEIGTTASSPIQMGEGKIGLKTGTATFDTNDNPGYDSNETNTIVRSHDQIIYLVSFTIQNSTKDQDYTNIRYRLKATLLTQSQKTVMVFRKSMEKLQTGLMLIREQVMVPSIRKVSWNRRLVIQDRSLSQL